MITVDDRVGSKRGETDAARHARRVSLVTGLQRFHLPARLGRLAFGDIAFRGHGPQETLPRIGIEMKRVSDLLTSMQNGRLAGHQIPGLVEQYPFRYLLIEGIMRPDPRTGIMQKPLGKGQWVDAGFGKRRTMYTDVLSFLNTLAMQAHVHVLRTASEQETLWQLVSLYTWWNKPWDQHKSLHVIDHARPSNGGVLLGNHSDLVRVAAQLPGVGYERARAVARVFPSIRSMSNGTEQEWREVEGIGSGIARKVVACLRGEEVAEVAEAPAARPQRPRGPRPAQLGDHGVRAAEGDRGRRAHGHRRTGERARGARD